MGDASDMADIDRFMRSEEGNKYLENIRAGLRGRMIVDVSFGNEVHCIATTLHLDDGNVFEAQQSEHEVDALRENFREAIEREYFKDFPERRP